MEAPETGAHMRADVAGDRVHSGPGPEAHNWGNRSLGRGSQAWTPLPSSRRHTHSGTAQLDLDCSMPSGKVAAESKARCRTRRKAVAEAEIEREVVVELVAA